MSDWYQIDNEFYILQFLSRGAEMKRFFSKDWHREVLWSGNEHVWKRQAPLLFPIIGKLKNDQYFYQEKTYHLPQHGFARDKEFKCILIEDEKIEFLLESDAETLAMYPFVFSLTVTYELIHSVLKVTYKVYNRDEKEMFFSIGAHPAFETKNCHFFEVQFERNEEQYFLLDNGTLDWQKPVLLKHQSLPLTSSLFSKDALIFKNLKSNYIDLINHRTHEVIRLKNMSKNYFGLWGAKETPFVCLEPWMGCHDLSNHDGQLTKKEGIVSLKSHDIFTFSYEIELRHEDLNTTN